MPRRLDDVYQISNKPQELLWLKSTREENHTVLIEFLSKEVRRTVLRIINALLITCNYKIKSSFIQEVKLGIKFANKLKNFNGHSLEKNTQ